MRQGGSLQKALKEPPLPRTQFMCITLPLSGRQAVCGAKQMAAGGLSTRGACYTHLKLRISVEGLS